MGNIPEEESSRACPMGIFGVSTQTVTANPIANRYSADADTVTRLGRSQLVLGRRQCAPSIAS